MMKLSAAVLTSAFWSSQAAPEWTPSDIQHRRLDVETGMSTSNKNSAECIVGGYEKKFPSRVYVGGPCSELNGSKPLAKFRYVVMETMDIDINAADAAGKKSVVDLVPYGSGTVNIQNKTTHLEVGVSGTFNVGGGKYSDAAMFASTTSYLAKSQIKYTTNTFVTGKTGDKYDELKMCVAPCCNPVPATGCNCANAKCPTTNIIANTGDYKYSLMAALFDKKASGGATGTGWEALVAKEGILKAGKKTLSGNFRVYQGMDFTNMKADTLTVTGSGVSTGYATMTACNLVKKTTTACTEYAVESIALKASDWEGLVYEFPKSYNRGQWTGKTSTTVADTRKVVIQCIKPDAASMKLLYKLTDTQAAAAKIVLLRYSFDMAGASATDKLGNYMVYDPIVTTKTKAAAKAAATGTSIGGVDVSGSSTSVPAMIVLGASALAAFVSV